MLNHIGGCKSPKFQAVELANEPNLYAGQGARSKDYSVEDYARQAAKFMDVLRENITCLDEGRKLQVFQNSSSTSDEAWSTETFMNKSKGIIDFKRVTSVAQHFYCTMDSTVLQETLLNHEFTASRTNTFFKNASRLVQGKAGQGATFIIDEVGNANVNKTNYDKDALSKSLGSAVWTVDWMLRINMQNGAEMAFAEWIPTRLQGGWYGHVFVADFIGKDAKNQLQVKELTSLSKNVGNKHMVGYAGYERGKLAKIALANLELWNGTESETERRPLANVSLGLDGVKDGTAVTARRLAGPNGTATSGLTWGGLDWPHSRGGVETSIKNDSVRFKVAGGKLDVSVNATEAMLLTW